MKCSLLMILVCAASCNGYIPSIRTNIDRCYVTIEHYRNDLDFSAAKIVFRTEREYNTNIELLTHEGTGREVERTYEIISGGLLNRIHIYPVGTFCLRELKIQCGQNTNQLYKERAIVIKAEAVVAKSPYILGWHQPGKCLLFSDDVKSKTSAALTVQNDAFTKCRSNDSDCISKFMWVVFRYWND